MTITAFGHRACGLATSDSTEVDDATLLHNHIRGDRQAFATLIQRHRRLLWRAIRHVGITCEEEGREVMQEALLKIHRHAPQWKGNAKVGTWLYSITRNTALSHLRSQSRRGEPDNVEFEERMRCIATKGWKEDATVLRVDLHRLLDRVATELKEVLLLTCVQGLSESEVGERLGIPVGTVKSRKSRARRVMRSLLQEEWGIGTQMAA